jgi:hypothetical protein
MAAHTKRSTILFSYGNILTHTGTALTHSRGNLDQPARHGHTVYPQISRKVLLSSSTLRSAMTEQNLIDTFQILVAQRRIVIVFITECVSSCPDTQEAHTVLYIL